MHRLKTPDVIIEPTLDTKCALDMTRGVIAYSVEDLVGVDPSARISLSGLSLSAGLMLGEIPIFTAPGNDPAIDVDTAAYDRVERESIENGLYVPQDDPRYEDGRQLVKCRVVKGYQKAVRKGLKLPFSPSFMGQPAVVFEEEDYLDVVRNAKALAQSNRTETDLHNRGRTGIAEMERRGSSSIAQTMKKYMKGLEVIEARIIEEKQILTSLYKQTRGTMSPRKNPYRYKAANLDPKRQYFDRRFYWLIELAAKNSGWSRQEIHDAHKADMSKRYRSGTRKEIDNAWRESIAILGGHNNAMLFKIWQSYEDCKPYADKYESAIRQEEAA